MAHEIAHNVLNHSQNAWLGVMLNTFLSATTGVPGDLAGTMPPRRSLEARADYVGAYIVARAGYDVRAIKQFCRRLERLRSRETTPEIDRDHPTTAERLAAFEETLKEIEDKRQRGEPLEPVSAEPQCAFPTRETLSPPHSPAIVFLASSDSGKVWLSCSAV